MACEVVVMNQCNPVMDGLYHHAPSWAQQPLSPELASPLHAQSPIGSVCSPASASSPLSHANSPLPAHSPMMQHVASPMQNHHNFLVKQEMESYSAQQFHGDSCNSLSSLLRSTAQEMLESGMGVCGVPNGCVMGPPAPQEILDGEFLFEFLLLFAFVRLYDCCM